MRSVFRPTGFYRIGSATFSKRPVGRPPNEVRRFHANFTHQAGSWTKPRRVTAKVEWHRGELYPRVGFIVANLSSGRQGRRLASSGSRKVRARQVPAHAGCLPPTQSGS